MYFWICSGSHTPPKLYEILDAEVKSNGIGKHYYNGSPEIVCGRTRLLLSVSDSDTNKIGIVSEHSHGHGSKNCASSIEEAVQMFDKACREWAKKRREDAKSDLALAAGYRERFEQLHNSAVAAEMEASALLEYPVEQAIKAAVANPALTID